MDAVRQLAHYTIDDIYNLPDGQRAELIDGELYMMATPNRIHQRLVMVLSNSIFNYIQEKSGNCEVYPSPFAVFLNADNEINYTPCGIMRARLDYRDCFASKPSDGL